jgi:hypothetical protein
MKHPNKKIEEWHQWQCWLNKTIRKRLKDKFIKVNLKDL